jgi:excisionase family DNA binding protein
MQMEATMTTSERIPQEPLMTMREVATALGVSERTARSVRASGRLPVVRPSPGTIRVRPEDLRQYIAENREGRVAFGRRRAS